MISAHGIGGPKDLPISLPLAIGGAGAAVAISFVVLIFAWRTPRYDGASSGRRVPWLSFVDSAWWAVLWRVVGFVLFLYTAMVGIFGKDLLVNPIFGIFYVWWWVGLVAASALFGPVWKAISPPRTVNGLIARLTNIRRRFPQIRTRRWVDGKRSDGSFGVLEQLVTAWADQ